MDEQAERPPYQVLVIESITEDFHALRDLLKSSYLPFQIRRVTTLPRALRTLDAEEIDVVILNLENPQRNVETRFKPVYQKLGNSAPIIVTVPYTKPGMAARLLGLGAQDFLVKSEITLAILTKSILFAIERARRERDVAQLHNTLEATEAELLQIAKTEAIGRLAVGIVHQLKNPLGTIRFGIDIISKKVSDDPLIKELLERMVRSTERADNIVSDLLDFSTAADFHPGDCDLNVLIDQVVDLVKHRLQTEKENIELRVNHLATQPIVTADEQKLKHALVNLLENAIEAIPDSINGLIEISAQRFEGNLLKITISDNGVGISDEDLARVTDPFFTTKAKTGGTGLGLSVAKRISRLHGGRLRIVPEEGKTQMIIEIPCA